MRPNNLSNLKRNTLQRKFIEPFPYFPPHTPFHCSFPTVKFGCCQNSPLSFLLITPFSLPTLLIWTPKANMQPTYDKLINHLKVLSQLMREQETLKL